MSEFSSKLGQPPSCSTMEVSIPWRFSLDTQLQIWNLMFPCSECFLKCGLVPILLLTCRIQFYFSDLIFFA